MKRAWRPGISAGLAVLLLIGCRPFSGSSGEYRIATSAAKSDAHLNGDTLGILRGRTNPDGTACLWIGQGSEAEAFFWPFGYSAGGNPVTVYDDSDKAVVTVGQHVEFGGGLLPDYVQQILGCKGFTNFWGVGLIARASWN